MANLFSSLATARSTVVTLVFATFAVVLMLGGGVGEGKRSVPGGNHSVATPAPAFRYAPAQRYGELPLRFEPNLGQTEAGVKFLARGDRSTLFLMPAEAVLSFDAHVSAAAGVGTSRLRPGARPLAPTLFQKNSVLRLVLLNGNPEAEISGLGRLGSVSNYFIGNDPAAWQTRIANYAAVRYRGIYPGVDLVLHGNRKALEYDFVVAPGRNPQRIRFRIQGSEHVRLDSRGCIVISTAAGDVHLERPHIYQEQDGTRTTVHGGYDLATQEHEISFRLGRYDKARPLVIDPVLSYSTFLGGTGGTTAFSVFVDRQGYAYVTGSAQAGFPTTSGVVMPVFGGGGEFNTNAFVSKLSPAGDSLVYSTYLGGTPGQDTAFSVVADSVGNAYVTGDTGSSNFPTVNAFQPNLKGINNINAFVTKLNPTGTALLYSTYLGGSTGTDIGEGIAVNTTGEAYVTGAAGSTDFPVLNPLQAKGSIFVTKFTSAGSALVYSTLFGGSSGGDTAYGIVTDSSGHAYVAGVSTSQDFPTTPGSVQPVPKTNENAFFSEFSPAGNGLLYSTLLGAGALTATWANGLALDGTGSVYLTGWTIASNTAASDFPTTPAVIEGTLAAGGGAAFVSKITPAGNGMSDLVYSTFLGGASRAGIAISQGNGIAVDNNGNAIVAGRTGAASFPTTPGALQSALKSQAGGFNAFVSKLNSGATQLLYSTYLGGSVEDQALGIAIDQAGSVYLAGQSLSTDFPTTAGAFQPNHLTPSGSLEGFVAKLPVSSVISVSPVSLDFGDQLLTQASGSQAVTLTNNSSTDLIFSAQPSLSGLNASEFALVSACGPTLAANASCSVSLTFTPKATGAALATISFFDSDPSSPQTVSVTGTGILDFSVSAPASETVALGSSAGFPVTVTPLGGSTQTVGLDCQGAPLYSTCSVSPAQVTLDGTHAANATATVQTQRGSVPVVENLPGPHYPVPLFAISVAMLAALLKLRQRRPRLIFGFAVMACVAFSACGGGSPHTPKGTFALVITGISGNQSHSANVSLTIR